jgi:oxygen-dependent protoporphyrinogen oxidase
MIAVIGAGITGLAAAYEIARAGAAVRLFEAAPHAGGLIRTEHVDGFTIEAGPDSVLAQKPAAIELFEELGLGPRIIATRPPRTAFVLHGSRLCALPSPSVLGIPLTWRGAAGYDLLSPAARARLALEPLIPRRGPEDESVAAFFRRRFGRATVDLVAAPLLGGIHAGDVERLSMRSLFPRFVEAEARRGSVLRAFRRAPASGRRDGLFRSLASGMSELVAAVERRLPADTVVRSAPVTGLGRDGAAWLVATAMGATRADAAILAVPAYAAGRLLADIDAPAAALCGEVRYASTASVTLAWPRAAVRHPLAGSGFVVARAHPRRRLTACTWVSSKWEGRAPDGDVLLRAFIGGVHDPEAVDLDDEGLVRVATTELSAILGIEGPARLARVHRWPNAGAQHDVGQLARVAAIEARLARHPGLLVAGSGFRSVGIPDCIADGRAAGAAAAHYVKMQEQR